MGLKIGRVWEVLEVVPSRVQVVAGGLRARHLTVADQGRICDGIEVSGGDPATTIGAEVASFTSLYASAMMALARELDLLAMELGRSVQAVVAVDQAGAR